MTSGPRGALVFDLDGTLADTIPVCVEAFRRTVLRHAGRDMSRAEIVSLFGPTEEGMLQRVLADDWRAALPDYLAHYAELHDGLAPFPGLCDALQRLRAAGARLAIVTGKGPRTTALSCRLLGLEGLFDPVATGSDAGAVKDRAIRGVLAGWGSPARCVAYVGDAPADVRAARAARVTAVAAAWAPRCEAAALEAERPDALFRDVRPFTEWAESFVRGTP